MVLILSNVGVTGSDYGMLCKVMGIIGLHKYEHIGTCPLLKVHIFLDIKHMHSACVADSLSFGTG